MTLPEKLSIGRYKPGPMGHELCDGANVVAVVCAKGYPLGLGWAAESEMLALELAARYNHHKALVGILKRLKGHFDNTAWLSPQEYLAALKEMDGAIEAAEKGEVPTV